MQLAAAMQAAGLACAHQVRLLSLRDFGAPQRHRRMVAMAVVERSEAEAADSASSSPPVAAATMATDLAHHHARQGTHRTHARSETTPVRSSAQLGVDGANSLAKHQLTPSRPQQQRRWQPRKEHVASTDTNSTRINNKSNTSASSSTSAITSRRRVDKAADEGSSGANRSGTSGVGSRRRKGGSNTGSPRGSTSATGAGGRSSSGAGARTGGGEGRVPGLQQRVVDHLVGGGFDEALLETVPPHTLNWVLKVRCCTAGVPLTYRWCGACCCVVWCGMVWCAVVWCGVVWCAVVARAAA